ncbi:hypothetical protein G9A89_009302 [Geosiphon pyriformis]|nr:hypothetical protein G9A89_009302 [Geosiphon pyriformis]
MLKCNLTTLPKQSLLINKSVTFDVFKMEFLKYFSNHNSINCLANTLTIIKQEETEAITTYLKCFHRNFLSMDYTVVFSNAYVQCTCKLFKTHNSANISSINDTAIILSSNISIGNTCNLSTTTITNNLSGTSNLNTIIKLSSNNIRKFQIKSYSKLEIGNSCLLTDPHLLITPEDALSNNQKTNHNQTLTNNILPAIVIENKSLTAIFLFKIEELSEISLFSGAALKKKPITVMYTNAKIDDHIIKLILDSGSAGSIITKQLMNQLANRTTKTPFGEIDNLLIKVNGIIILIKLSKINATFDWTIQKLQLISTTYGYFKPKTYQVFWANKNHNELPPILTWDNNRKRKQKEKLIWNTDQTLWNNSDYNKLPPDWE